MLFSLFMPQTFSQPRTTHSLATCEVVWIRAARSCRGSNTSSSCPNATRLLPKPSDETLHYSVRDQLESTASSLSFFVGESAEYAQKEGGYVPVAPKPHRPKTRALSQRIYSRSHQASQHNTKHELGETFTSRSHFLLDCACHCSCNVLPTHVRTG